MVPPETTTSPDPVAATAPVAAFWVAVSVGAADGGLRAVPTHDRNVWAGNGAAGNGQFVGIVDGGVVRGVGLDRPVFYVQRSRIADRRDVARADLASVYGELARGGNGDGGIAVGAVHAPAATAVFQRRILALDREGHVAGADAFPVQVDGDFLVLGNGHAFVDGFVERDDVGLFVVLVVVVRDVRHRRCEAVVAFRFAVALLHGQRACGGGGGAGKRGVWRGVAEFGCQGSAGILRSGVGSASLGFLVGRIIRGILLIRAGIGRPLRSVWRIARFLRCAGRSLVGTVGICMQRNAHGGGQHDGERQVRRAREVRYRSHV